MDLVARWNRLMDKLRFSQRREQILDNLKVQYTTGTRAYHTLDGHVVHCLEELDTVRDKLDSPHIAELALWFHDAVYQPPLTSNEAASVMYMHDQMRGLDHRLLSMAAYHIFATHPDDDEAARHLRTSHLSETARRSVEADQWYVKDIDFAILGQPEERYREYAAQIREEYSFAADPVYNTARREFLEKLLSREALFFTGTFAQRYEAQARKNIAAEIERLA
jgi:predicted metal-dependent HD superfamily phosphohydrolase